MEPDVVRSTFGEIEVFVCSDDENPVKCICTRVDIKRCYDRDESVKCIESEDETSEYRSFEDINRQIGQLEIGQDPSEPSDSIESYSKNDNIQTEYIIIDERKAMAALGLPTAFGDKRKHRKNKRKTRIGKEEFATFLMPTLKTHYGVHSLESARSIFEKMGYFHEIERSLPESQSVSEQIDKKETKDSCRADGNLEVQFQDVNNSVESDESTKSATNDDSEQTRVNAERTASSESNALPILKDDHRENCVNVHENGYDPQEGSSSDYNSAQSQLEGEIILKDIKKQSKNKRQKPKKKNIPDEILQDKVLIKYYRKRYTLFSLYDCGIALDREAWFSATPECIAIHTANRLRCDVIIDAFCGTGSNAIQFAKTCNKVIAIDINPDKIEKAKHNANIYGVLDKIDFIVGDYIQLATHLKADVVFLSPPWGGPNYKRNIIYDLEEHLLPVPGSTLFKLTSQITKNVAMYLPKNTSTKQLMILAGAGNQVELEQNFLGSRLTAITAYYGDLVRSQ